MKTTQSIGIAGIGALLLAGAVSCASTGDGASNAESDDCTAAEYRMSIKWQQQSAEARALQAQVFAEAGQQLDQAVAEAADDQNLAVITDLDETAIDNSDLLARDVSQCHDYSGWDTWDHWEREGQPRAIPGAVDFFSHADELGVDVFYISDRTVEHQDETVASLEDLGFPQVSDDSVLLLGPPKTERREAVEKDHTVLMLLGDSLPDFDGRFADASLEDQQALVDENQGKFGTEWIMLPNPTYGAWEDADLTEWDAPIEVQE